MKIYQIQSSESVNLSDFKDSKCVNRFEFSPVTSANFKNESECLTQLFVEDIIDVNCDEQSFGLLDVIPAYQWYNNTIDRLTHSNFESFIDNVAEIKDVFSYFSGRGMFVLDDCMLSPVQLWKTMFENPKLKYFIVGVADTDNY